MTHHSPIEIDAPFIPAPSNTAPNLPAIIDHLPPDGAHPPQTQFTRARQAAFLRLLADSGEVRVAAKAAHVSHQTVYRMRRACQTFRTGWDAALIVARERAEEELATRAIHGIEEQVFYHGEVVATRRRHDSRLLLAHLARLDRMAEREDLADLAGCFDEVVAAFEGAGEAEVELPRSAPEPAGEAPDKTSSGPCNMRSMSPAEEKPVEREEQAEEPYDDPHNIDARVRAMDEARPAGAPFPWDLSNERYDSGHVLAVQLAAFEAGEERWWEVLPGEAEEGGEVEPLR